MRLLLLLAVAHYGCAWLARRGCADVRRACSCLLAPLSRMHVTPREEEKGEGNYPEPEPRTENRKERKKTHKILERGRERAPVASSQWSQRRFF